MWAAHRWRRTSKLHARYITEDSPKGGGIAGEERAEATVCGGSVKELRELSGGFDGDQKRLGEASGRVCLAH